MYQWKHRDVHFNVHFCNADHISGINAHKSGVHMRRRKDKIALGTRRYSK